MKIRLALIDGDEDYRKRLSDFYIKNYHDKIEILNFSSLDSFENNRGNKTIDIMLVSETIDKYCVFIRQGFNREKKQYKDNK